MRKWFLLVFCYIASFALHANPLPASEVFHVNVTKVDPNTFAINFQIKPDYFLYSKRIKLASKSDSSIHLGPLRLPPTVKKTDKQGHVYAVYRNQVSIPVSILADKPGETYVDLHYQGCSDDGFCYAPETKAIRLSIDNNLALAQANLEQVAKEPVITEETQNDSISNVFLSHNWFFILITFYGFGLLLSFTPCILPMVPVLSGIIVGHGKELSTRKAFFLSLSYVLSMSVTYAIIGAVVALLGANLQISMQSPWAIGIFSLIFILLALSMFGFYEFKLPHSWQAKIHGTSNRRGGHYLGAAIMGCLSTLILSPCVTAPLIGVLTYIAQTGNVLLGCLTLFILGLGMGTPLLLIGTSAGRWLPETGSWMNTIKALFGILFIAVAIDLVSRIVPSLISMGLWAFLLIFSGIYSGALTYSTTNREKFSQGIGLILLVYGFLILVGASMGATNPLQPLTNAYTANAPAVKTQQTLNLSDIKQAILEAQGKPIILDFYADWCHSCKVMEATTFKDPQVQDALTRFKVIKIDVTTQNSENKAILTYFDVVAPPTFVFFNTKGAEINQFKLVGEISTDKFLKTLNQIQ
ncbi:protein-disulfide reductase DsbD [Legionella longbeachae]|uniref:Putative thiol:disulfide interchange protein DsbD n=1 Tax=Legionella longbeachae serogroup 1 (strain NSW150) TaxID=661367 RepID=D3HPY5_LEGLN|nr:protein-disulfide reductase DsbD [Legionella longbeachae]VEE01470.1 thiol:disulfide interchange protein DsbD [Legionella oakridgensis]ARB92172.1 protein-disulfide reductase DsbD [Legionella longbeachae]ARM34648.1 protein-disulfide reductase DsbD [Legionella longbeachae]EEZ96049.1 thiol:disulfide interchange protein DsbD [Legionella longbeachae D-4968]QIN31406.1 protein-disulfide reductase DsbD [Legionella longbeachae]